MSAQIMSHHKLEKDDYSRLFYSPRTISLIVFLVGLMNFLSYTYIEQQQEEWNDYFYDEKNPDIYREYRWPLFYAFLVIVAFGSAQFPDSLVRRPHPVFWRILQGIFLAYSIFITFVLLLSRDQARQIFKVFHPSMGVALPEKNYADDCRVFTPENPNSSMNNLYEAVFDVHFIAHLGGWWFKMMIIRDTKMAWIISGSFELIEISLRHWLPNFWECWWDHVSINDNHFILILFIFYISFSWICSDATCLV